MPLAFILINSEVSSDLKTIITISARHMSSVERTLKLIEIMKRHESASLNLVAGNRVYLAGKEIKRSAAKRLANLARIVRRCLRDRVVFIGTEGLTEIALEIAVEHDLVPFLLLGKEQAVAASATTQVKHTLIFDVPNEFQSHPFFQGDERIGILVVRRSPLVVTFDDTHLLESYPLVCSQFSHI